MIGCTGRDELAAANVASLAALGVNVTMIQQLRDISTGIAVILSNASDKRMIICPGANAGLDLERVSIGDLPDGAHVHVAFADDSRVLPFLRRVRDAGLTVSCDFSGVHSDARAELCDIALMNRDELYGWTQEWPPNQWWASRSEGCLVVTDGTNGAYVFLGESTSYAAAQAVSTVDRTGAGDAFDAGFLSAWSRDATIEQALKEGLALAGSVVGFRGARPHPSRPDGHTE
jgi:alpha-D-ribose-1-phosphate 5-kinase (ADP)